jgi:asparagine synthase (glutamine-hydrolysing)
LGIIHEILSQQLSLNFEYLSSVLLQNTLPTTNTLFKGINELSVGCELGMTQELIETKLSWNPIDYCQNIQDEAFFIKEISDSLLNTLITLTSPLKNILLEFSGGLDSSALLFCLKKILKNDQTLTAINIFDSSIESSNELRHARRIAKEIGVDLIELDFADSLPFSFSERLEYKPYKPFLELQLIKIDRKMADIAKSCKGAYFISGHGGDHIFMCPPPIESLADLVIDKNFNLRHKITELSLYYREPLYPLLKHALKSYFLYLFASLHKSIAFDKHTIPPWLKNEVYLLSKKIKLHPFYEIRNHNIPPGKFSQINALYNGLNSTSHYMISENNPILYPLFSQPMLELALAIPSYKLYSKEFDRYLFRQSIHKLFNTNSVWRTDKGGITGVMQQGYKKNIKKIMELCLDGHFARAGLLEKDLLEKDLKKISSGYYSDNLLFFDQLITLEMFLTYWE